MAGMAAVLRSVLVLPLLLAGCGSDDDGGSSGLRAAPVSGPVTGVVDGELPLAARPMVGWQAARAGAVHESALLRCLVGEAAGRCRLADLPLLGAGGTAPTREEVMGRVVVSAPWMGRRFERVLDELPSDLLHLMRGVTGIVVGGDVRPSHYRIDSGAIYLDAGDFWLTAGERNDVAAGDDPRTDFGNELASVWLWRYTLDGRRVARPSAVAPRGFADVRLRIYSVLVHELVHANDYFDPRRSLVLEQGLRVAEAALSSELPSDRLAAALGLGSYRLQRLAEVSFLGRRASAEERMLDAAGFAFEFGNDFANDYYAYATLREDLAMLVEELIMRQYFGLRRDIAVTPQPEDARLCSDYVVGWGVRDRIAEPAVARRALFAARLVAPDLLEVLEEIDEAPLPRPLPVGVDWCSGLELIDGGVVPGAAGTRVFDPAARLPYHVIGR